MSKRDVKIEGGCNGAEREATVEGVTQRYHGEKHSIHLWADGWQERKHIIKRGRYISGIICTLLLAGVCVSDLVRGKLFWVI